MTYPLPPTDMLMMPQALQYQFTLMQIPLVILSAAFCLWGAKKHQSLVPVWMFLSGGIAYMGEPLVNVLGLVWYPPQGINAVFESMGRPVPWFGFLAYLWFLGGMSFFVYDRMKKGMTTRSLWRLYAILVVVETLLEVPGLNMDVYTYYGNQPFVFMKSQIWWPFLNATSPMVAGALVYRMLPFIKPALRPITIYSVPLANAMVMGGAGLPVEFVLNTDAGLAVTHLMGALTIALALFMIYMVTLLAATDSKANMRQASL